MWVVAGRWGGDDEDDEDHEGDEGGTYGQAWWKWFEVGKGETRGRRFGWVGERGRRFAVFTLGAYSSAVYLGSSTFVWNAATRRANERWSLVESSCHGELYLATTRAGAVVR